MRRSVLALLLSLSSVLPAMAQDKPVNLKISLWIPASLPLVPAYTAWGQSMQKASGGTITSTVFPSEQLGKAFDHYDMARDGIVDVAYVNPGYQPGRFPIIALGQIPFTFRDGHSGTQAIDAFYRKYAEKEMKDVHFCFAFIHDPGTLHSRVKITTPSDLKGVKVRPAQSTVGQMVTLLGGTNVQASAPESRDAIERGVADAIFFPWNSMFNFGIDKVVKYHLDVPLYTSVFVTVMNKAKYDAMSPAQKKVVDDHCTTEWAEKVAGPWTDFEAAGHERMRQQPGHEFVELSEAQIAEWRASVAPLFDRWAASVKEAGADPAQVAAELKVAIGKYEAAK
ncbi:TRAP transporter substrate-binding protein [Bradyrhizobium sp. NP1]|uniref:TRAP transporter substrate-binding protein n=1 Tax=Bradyrhizobium sp. NP1 TaxID=3049772 RepID=UPI0025A5849E|nr:TRAP transporter substrate-binding protein [Bradyrhizobium sp. NP1]WJR76608.1 TRAP transporter substrate-binding protein [Bradyrhizobium sp. NP1]